VAGWRGPSEPGEFATLGYEVADWIEAHLVVPDGDHLGEPFVLTDEQLRFLLHFYRLDPVTQRFVYRRGQLMRPQKWGKGPLLAAISAAEFLGPVLPAGWDASGEPVGRPWATPWVQIAATSEDQTDNTFASLYAMLTEGPLADRRDLDVGLSRVFLQNGVGGRIEPVTASANSRLGNRVTFVCQDETHLWVVSNGGVKLAANQRRNLAGMGGRSVETTNCFDPGEQSVAQRTHERRSKSVLIDHRPGPSVPIVEGPELLEALRLAYGDSWWVPLPDIMAEALEQPEEAPRFFLNIITASEGSWIDLERWRALATPERLLPGDQVGLGFDGSRRDDATALVACRLSDGLVQCLQVWERPAGPAGDDWQVPRVEVRAAVAVAFEMFEVALFKADPPLWQDDVDAWSAEWPKRVEEFWTNSPRRMVQALERFHSAVISAELRHTDDPDLNRHVGNTRRVSTRAGTQIGKHSKARKIDATVAAVLAVEARADAIADGALVGAIDVTQSIY